MPIMIPGSDRRWDPKAGPGGTGGYVPATPQYYPEPTRTSTGGSTGGGTAPGGYSTGIYTNPNPKPPGSTTGAATAGTGAAQASAASGGTTNWSTDQYGNPIYSGTTGDPKVLAEQERLRLENQYRLGQMGAEAGYQTEAQREQARLQQEAEARRFSQFSPYFQSLMGGMSGGGGGAVPPRETYGGAAADAARQAAFARAKDQAGQISRASLTGLRNALGERGIGGSGIEAMQSAGILENAGGMLGDVNREQLIQDLAAQQHAADISYQGGVQQRGQDIQAQQAQRQALMGLFNQMFGGDITARY